MIDDVPEDIMRIILAKFLPFERTKLRMTCQRLKNIPCMYEFEEELKYFLNNQILYLHKEWKNLWSIKKNSIECSCTSFCTQPPEKLITFILQKNLTKKKLVSCKYMMGRKMNNRKYNVMNMIGDDINMIGDDMDIFFNNAV